METAYCEEWLPSDDGLAPRIPAVEQLPHKAVNSGRDASGRVVRGGSAVVQVRDLGAFLTFGNLILACLDEFEADLLALQSPKAIDQAKKSAS